MNFRNLSKIALAAVLSCTMLLEGCKKYDDDIAGLRDQIGNINTDVAALKTSLAQLAKTYVVKSVTPVTGGFKIVFTDPSGKDIEYSIVNGAQGLPGINAKTPTFTIVDGYWHVKYEGDATATKLGKAQGDEGQQGKKPIFSIVDGDWYVKYEGDTGAPTKVGPAKGEPGTNAKQPLFTIGTNGNWWVQYDDEAPIDLQMKAQGKAGEDAKQPEFTIVNGNWYVSYDGSTPALVGPAKGNPGQDAKQPEFSIGVDGHWYVSYDGGTPIKLGSAKGDPGQDAKQPQFSIGVDGHWYVTYDNGANTERLGQATGKAGSVVTIVDEGGKKYWAIDGEITTPPIQAYAGNMAIEQVSGGYNVIFTDSEGNTFDSIFLAKEKNSITSIALLPIFAENNVPVLTFPRIVTNTPSRPTLMQGSGLFTYKLNPFGVNASYYSVEGLVSQTVQNAPIFRSSGDNLADFTVSTISKTFSEVTIAATPNKSGLFPENSSNEKLHLALRINNTKADAIAGNTGNKQNKVVSRYDLAKEEIIFLNEVSIERHETTSDGKIILPQTDFGGLGSPYFSNPPHNNELNTLVGTSNPTATGINQVVSTTDIANKSMPTFLLNIYEDAERVIPNKLPILPSYNYRGGIDLNKELKGFFVRNFASPKLISMDDNGLSGYSFKFSKVSYGSGGNDFADDIELVDGHISVAERTDGFYNSAALNRTPVVKVDMYAPNGTTLLATRFVKIQIVNTPAAPVTIKGAATFDMTNAGASILSGTDVEVDFVEPNTFDAAYNLLGLDQNAFITNYNYAGISSVTKDGQPYPNPSGLLDPKRIRINPVWSNTPGRNYFTLNIGSQVLPGEYIITATCTSPDVTKPVVTVQITLTVTGNNIQTLVKEPTFWDANLMYGIVNGLNNVGGPNIWQLNANLWNYWDMSPITADLPIGAPNTTFEFSVSGYPGITVSSGTLSTALVTLDAIVKAARNRVNGGDVNITIKTYVNTALHKTETFPIKFKNPVNPVTVNANYRNLLDKENTANNTSTFDLRRSIDVKDFNGQTIFGHTVTGFGNVNWTNNGTLKTRYDIGGISNSANTPLTDVSVVGAYSGIITNHVGKTKMTLVNATATISNNNLVWTNNGANILQPITIVVRVAVTNKWNLGDTVNPADAQASEVVKYVYITVNPNIQP